MSRKNQIKILPVIRYLASIFSFSHNRAYPRIDVSDCNLDKSLHKFPMRQDFRTTMYFRITLTEFESLFTNSKAMLVYSYGWFQVSKRQIKTSVITQQSEDLLFTIIAKIIDNFAMSLNIYF